MSTWQIVNCMNTSNQLKVRGDSRTVMDISLEWYTYMYSNCGLWVNKKQNRELLINILIIFLKIRESSVHFTSVLYSLPVSNHKSCLIILDTEYCTIYIILLNCYSVSHVAIGGIVTQNCWINMFYHLLHQRTYVAKKQKGYIFIRKTLICLFF